ncbi:putative amino-acid permease P7G5.06 like protein [Verticillium longisporum]|uniref:Putative amino-acid permease P7G5.06 like protein n=1 Tax=Verticillium longisporum TaxID=100787 RepID=A0A8I2Z516_VERLO|nr:putative amino-acid permease P7G5.06 like protein [Verticillium longisporum]
MEPKAPNDGSRPMFVSKRVVGAHDSLEQVIVTDNPITANRPLPIPVRDAHAVERPRTPTGKSSIHWDDGVNPVVLPRAFKTPRGYMSPYVDQNGSPIQRSLRRSFYEYARRFISEPWGFTMGWNFVFAWLIIFPFELSCIVSQIRFWNDTVSPAVIIAPILAGLIVASFGGSRFYGEIEHGLGIAKVSALTIFIGMAIAIMAGAVPSDARHGTGVKFWTTRDVIANGFPGFMTLFRIAGMSYGGTELLGMTAAECNNPRRALPLATKITFFRIALFYVLTLLFLGFVVDSQDPGLAKIGHGAQVSPFTLAAQRAGIKVLPDLFNVFVVLALLSMANASIYASSRALQALCEQGMGPRFAATIKWGVPIYAFALAFTIGLTAFVNVASGGAVIFDWLLSLSGACNYYTWLSICASHIRFRRAWHTQGHSLDELLWTSPFGVWGSWIGIAICSTGLLASIVTSIYPLYGIHSAQGAGHVPH